MNLIVSLLQSAQDSTHAAGNPTPAPWLLEGAKLIGAGVVGYFTHILQLGVSRRHECHSAAKALTVPAGDILTSLRRNIANLGPLLPGGEVSVRSYFSMTPEAMPASALGRFLKRGRSALPFKQATCHHVNGLCDQLETLGKQHKNMLDVVSIHTSWHSQAQAYFGLMTASENALSRALSLVRRQADSDTKRDIDRLLTGAQL